MPRPDLVGITAFTSQANRAYEVAAHFRRLGVPVVMGGIHATMCLDEVLERVDSVVTGEAEGVWAAGPGGRPAGPPEAPVRRRARRHGRRPAGPPRSAARAIRLRRHPDHARLSPELQLLQRDGVQRRPLPAAAHRRRRPRIPVDPGETGPGGGRQPHRHAPGAHRPRQGPVPRPGPGEPGQEMDRPGHHQLRRRRGTAGAGRARPGAGACSSASSPRRRKGFGNSARSSTCSRAGISAPPCGASSGTTSWSWVRSSSAWTSTNRASARRIAEAASRYGVDNLNALFLTPLPGTRLWDQMKSEDRIALDAFPEDWKYYTLTFPVARYKHFSRGRHHPGNDLLQPALLFPAAHSAPGVEQLLATPPAADQPGGQSLLPEQHPRGLPEPTRTSSTICAVSSAQTKGNNCNQGSHEAWSQKGRIARR